LKNPTGPGGLAGIVEFPNALNLAPEVIFKEGYKATTSNRMELLACIRALEYIGSGVPAQRVLMIADSPYVHKFHGRAIYWKAQGWKSADGKPVDNSDLWKEFVGLRSKVRVSWEIPGKSSKAGREYNDSRPHRSLGERTPSEFACQIALQGDLPGSQTVGN
jgi:ribonuclease HI